MGVTKNNEKDDNKTACEFDLFINETNNLFIIINNYCNGTSRLLL